MRKHIIGFGIVLGILLAGCSERQNVDRFNGRMAGAAEPVNGILYVMGGMTLSGNLSEVGAYDSSTKTWTPKTAIPTPRSLGASVVFGEDIYMIGGRNNDVVLSTVEKYSTTQNEWLSGASMPTARWSLMACNAGGKLYTFGGLSGTGSNRRALDVVEAYDPNSNSWESVGKMPEARQSAAVAEVDGLIYVISGKIASYVESTINELITSRVDSFDPKTNAWARVQDIPTGRVGSTAVVANGLIFVVGGMATGGGFPTEIEVYDPQSNQWSVGPGLKSGRSAHMCALVGDSIVVFGGSSVRYGSNRLSINESMETISLSEYRQN